MSCMRDDTVTPPVHARFRRGDPLVHIVNITPRAHYWGSFRCGALYQWEPGTERLADRTDDAVTCLQCMGAEPR